MSNSTLLTKDWLKKTISRMEADFKYLGAEQDEVITIDALKLALASMEAVPVTYADPQADSKPSYYINRIDYGDGTVELKTYETELDAMKSRDDHGGVIITLCASPQVLVVPPEQNWEELCLQHPDMSIGDAIIRAAWWNLCRAAMLNVAPKVG